MREKLLVVLVTTLVALGVPATAAGATSVPDLVCQPTGTTEISSSVRLREDVSCPELDASSSTPRQLTIDLNGHTLTGNIVGFGAGPTIKKGTVDGDVEAVGDVAVSHVHVTGSVGSPYRVLSFGGSVTVRYSQVDEGVTGGSNPTDIDHSVIVGGIVCCTDEESGQEFSITDNVITDSSGPGISIEDYSAMYYGAPDETGTISGNLIYRSAGDGLSAYVTGLAGVRISRNWFVGNGGDGIALSSDAWPHVQRVGGSASLRGNIAIGNAGHGFDLTAAGLDTLVDAGHNLAVLNLTGPQCVGLSCTG